MWISPGELSEAIINIKATSSPCPDLVSASFIHNYISILLVPNLIMINSFLLSGIFLKVWNSCFIRPIHKEVSRNNVKNYRTYYLCQRSLKTAWLYCCCYIVYLNQAWHISQATCLHGLSFNLVYSCAFHKLCIWVFWIRWANGRFLPRFFPCLPLW